MEKKKKKIIKKKKKIKMEKTNQSITDSNRIFESKKL